jgi:hypothetical protein
VSDYDLLGEGFIGDQNHSKSETGKKGKARSNRAQLL